MLIANRFTYVHLFAFLICPGLKEQNNSSMKKSPSLKSAAATHASHGSMGYSPALQVRRVMLIHA